MVMMSRDVMMMKFELLGNVKFVPGQVITLKNGEQKFVPGVTDKNGRFTPGQIIETVSLILQ